MTKEDIILKLKNDPSYIDKVENPTKEMFLYMVKNNGNNIKY